MNLHFHFLSQITLAKLEVWLLLLFLDRVDLFGKYNVNMTNGNHVIIVESCIKLKWFSLSQKDLNVLTTANL